MSESKHGGEAKPQVIFAATDFSENSDEALRQAHARAQAAAATLVVCHVVPNLMRQNMLFPQRHAQETDARTELHRQARQALIAHTSQVTGRKDSEFEAVIDDGTPYASIVEHAERAGADLIVVGDRGSSGLARMLLGSVAERVLRYAHAPVLIARAAAKSGQVLVATDLSDPSLPAVVAAARDARRMGAKLTAMHCIESVSMAIGPEYGPAWAPLLPNDALRGARESALARLAEMFQRLKLDADQRVVEGSPAATILSTAEELGAELIVLGTRGRTGLQRVLLGSVAESVVRHSSCSVLAVRLRDGEAADPATAQG